MIDLNYCRSLDISRVPTAELIVLLTGLQHELGQEFTSGRSFNYQEQLELSQRLEAELNHRVPVPVVAEPVEAATPVDDPPRFDYHGHDLATCLDWLQTSDSYADYQERIVRRRAVYDYLGKLSTERRRQVLARAVRELYLTDLAIAGGGGIADVLRFVEWCKKELPICSW